MENAWAVGDLAQLDYEYKVQNNPSLFRIRSIINGIATLGQLSNGAGSDDYQGVDTTIAVDDPDLVRPYPEILAQYSRHIR